MKGVFKEEGNVRINIYNIKGWKHSRNLSLFHLGKKIDLYLYDMKLSLNYFPAFPTACKADGSHYEG